MNYTHEQIEERITMLCQLLWEVEALRAEKERIETQAERMSKLIDVQGHAVTKILALERQLAEMKSLQCGQCATNASLREQLAAEKEAHQESKDWRNT